MLACYQPDLSAGGTLTECGAGCPVNHWCREGYCLPEDDIGTAVVVDGGSGTNLPNEDVGIRVEVDGGGGAVRLDGGQSVTDTGAQVAECGNGIVDPAESCDDQNTDETDSCLNDCRWNTTLPLDCHDNRRESVGWEYNGHLYWLCHADLRRLNWNQWVEKCASWGGYLATVSDHEEKAQIAAHSGPHGYFLGAREVAGRWAWHTGEVMNTTIDEVPQDCLTIYNPNESGYRSRGCNDLQTAGLAVCEFGPLNATQVIPTSCQEIKVNNPASASGEYMIDPDGAGDVAPLSVYCDQSTSSGGWLRAVRISREAGVWNAFEQEVNLDRAGADSGDFNIPFSYFSNDPEGRDLEFFFKVDGIRKGSFYRHVHRNAWNPQINVRTNIWQDFDYKPQGEGATWTRCEGNNYHIHSDWNWSIGREQGEGDACGSVQLGEGAQGFILHGSTSETAEALFGLGEYSADRDWATLEVFLRPASGD